MNKISIFGLAKSVFYDTFQCQADNNEKDRKLMEDKIAQEIDDKIEQLVGFVPIEIRPVIVPGRVPDTVDIADIEIVPKSCRGLTVKISMGKGEAGEHDGSI